MDNKGVKKNNINESHIYIHKPDGNVKFCYLVHVQKFFIRQFLQRQRKLHRCTIQVLNSLSIALNSTLTVTKTKI